MMHLEELDELAAAAALTFHLRPNIELLYPPRGPSTRSASQKDCVPYNLAKFLKLSGTAFDTGDIVGESFVLNATV
jgi:hypothetical protein